MVLLLDWGYLEALLELCRVPILSNIRCLLKTMVTIPNAEALHTLYLEAQDRQRAEERCEQCTLRSGMEPLCWCSFFLWFGVGGRSRSNFLAAIIWVQAQTYDEDSGFHSLSIYIYCTCMYIVINTCVYIYI